MFARVDDGLGGHHAVMVFGGHVQANVRYFDIVDPSSGEALSVPFAEFAAYYAKYDEDVGESVGAAVVFWRET